MAKVNIKNVKGTRWSVFKISMDRPNQFQNFYCTPFVQRYSSLSHDVQSHSQICFIMILADRQSIAVQRQNVKHLIEKSPKVLFFHPRPHICLPSLLLCESTTQQSPRRPHTNCRRVCQLYTNDTGTFSFSHYPWYTLFIVRSMDNLYFFGCSGIVLFPRVDKCYNPSEHDLMNSIKIKQNVPFIEKSSKFFPQVL